MPRKTLLFSCLILRWQISETKNPRCSIDVVRWATSKLYLGYPDESITQRMVSKYMYGGIDDDVTEARTN